MKWVLKLFNFYLDSSIHVSLAVVSLQLVSCRLLNISCDSDLLFFTFFASITGYNYIKYSKLAKWHHLKLTESLRIIQIFSLLSFLAMLYFMRALTYEVLVACLILGGITVLYALPVFSKKRSLRSLSGVKIYVIALVWAGVSVVLPLLQLLEVFNWDAGVLLLQLSLFVVVITLPFDIRDLQYDEISIGTIPMRIGVKRTKVVGAVLLFLFVLLEALKDKITSETIVPLLVICILAFFLLLTASVKQSRYYASFWVESLPIIWLAILNTFSQFIAPSL